MQNAKLFYKIKIMNYKTTKLIFLTVLFFGIFGLARTSQAATINAASCNQSDMQMAINASSDGDTIIIPAGNCVWTAYVIVPNTKGLTIQGAGIGQTTIRDNMATHGYQQALFFVQVTSGKFTRITGMTLDVNNQSTTNGVIYINGNDGGQNFRVDHIKFINYGNGRGIKIDGYTYGLVDNNIFIGGGHSIDSFGDGSASWLRPASLGTDNAVYIENNTFDFSVSGRSDGVTDAYGGARYVFRYNNVIGTNIGHHGNDSGNYRSPITFEIYNNSFVNNSPANIFTWGNFRGGTGVIFNNIISAGTKTYNSFAILHDYRSCTYFEGMHDGRDGSAFLSDSTANFGAGLQGVLTNGLYVYNLTAGSYCAITSHTDSGPATAVCTLHGGTRQTWKNGDYYGIHYIQAKARIFNLYLSPSLNRPNRGL